MEIATLKPTTPVPYCYKVLYEYIASRGYSVTAVVKFAKSIPIHVKHLSLYTLLVNLEDARAKAKTMETKAMMVELSKELSRLILREFLAEKSPNIKKPKHHEFPCEISEKLSEFITGLARLMSVEISKSFLIIRNTLMSCCRFGEFERTRFAQSKGSDTFPSCCICREHGEDLCSCSISTCHCSKVFHKECTYKFLKYMQGEIICPSHWCMECGCNGIFTPAIRSCEHCCCGSCATHAFTNTMSFECEFCKAMQLPQF